MDMNEPFENLKMTYLDESKNVIINKKVQVQLSNEVDTGGNFMTGTVRHENDARIILETDSGDLFAISWSAIRRVKILL